MAQCCGEEMYQDCNGNQRCEQCQPPCPCCYDGGMDDYDGGMDDQEEEEAYWLNMFEDEADYVPYFWKNKTPVQTVGKVRIYLVQDEAALFDDLMGRMQVNLAECANGKVMEIA